MQAEADMVPGDELSAGQIGLIKVAAMEAVQPFLDRLDDVAKDTAQLCQWREDVVTEKDQARTRAWKLAAIFVPLAAAVIGTAAVWAWSQHTATVELRTTLEQQALNVDQLTKIVQGVNRRSNSQAESFTSLKGSVDDVLTAHRKLLSKSRDVDWVSELPPAARGRVERIKRAHWRQK